MKVIRLLDDAEVAEILKQHGIQAPNRQGGNKTLKELGLNEALKEAVEDDLKPYTYRQIYDELKINTLNFTKPGEDYTYYFESEFEIAMRILNKKYKYVDYYIDDCSTGPEHLKWMISFSNDSLEESLNRQQLIAELKSKGKKI
jgi:hypothetical protein